jgi:Tfp pilus assembly protein PilO
MKLNNILIIIKRYEIILISSIVIFTLLILTFTIALPNYLKSQEIYTNSKALEKQLSILKEKDKILSSIDETTYKENLNKLTKIITQTQDYISLFSRLDNLQANSGVIILKSDFELGVIATSTAMKKSIPEGVLAELPLSVHIQGTNDSILTFFQDINNFSGRLFAINDISWNKPLDSEGYNVVLNMNAYYYQLPTINLNMSASLPKLTQEEELILSKIKENIQLNQAEIEENINSGKKNLFN